MTLGIILPLGPEQIALFRLWRFDQRQQPQGSRAQGAIGQQTARTAVLPQQGASGSRGKQPLAEHSMQ
jgi:hypothetical protein